MKEKDKISSGQRLIRLYRYMYEHTDEEHLVSMNEICREMKARGDVGNHSTILKAIKDLAAEETGVCSVGEKISTQYLFDEKKRPLSLQEIRMLMDAVASSQILSSHKTEELIGKLSSMASIYQAEKMKCNIYTANLLKPENEGIYRIIDAVNTAIAEKKKVRLRYWDYTPDKEKVLKHSGKRYVVSPYTLVISNGYYYVVGRSEMHNNEIVDFRVDRIADCVILDADAQPEGNLDIERYIQQMVNMYTGEVVEAILECDNDLMRSVIDRFGMSVETWRVEGKDAFGVRALVTDSPTFFAWVFQFMGRIRIKGPQSLVEKYREAAKQASDTSES